MIRFSAQGAYLLLVPQERTLIRDRALISFLRNNQMFKKRFNIYLKRTTFETVTVTNVTLHRILMLKVKARARHAFTLKQKNLF